MLRMMAVAYLGCLVAYRFTVCVLQKIQAQTMIFNAAIAVQLVFILVVFWYSKRKTIDYTVVQTLITVFTLLIHAGTITLGTVVFRNQSAVLFPLMLILMAQIYAMPLTWTVSVISIYSLIFLVLSALLKPAEIFTLDVAATGVAYFVAFLSLSTIMWYRVKEFNSNQNLKKMCTVDLMTGVYNKTTLEFLCDKYIESLRVYQPFALVILDFDNFKLINDQCGHQTGDQFLKVFVQTLREFLEELPYEYLIGRFGGDEFVFLLKKVPSERVEGVCRQLSERLSTIIWHELSLKASCSMGIAMNFPGAKYQALFSRADQALYQAKQSGKNQCRVFKESDL